MKHSHLLSSQFTTVLFMPFIYVLYMPVNKIETTTHTFSKQERLCSIKAIEALFADGKTINHFPFRIVYALRPALDIYPAQVAMSVPKRSFKRAVKRNHLKRRMREAYRLNKQVVYQALQSSNFTLHFMFIYVSTRIAEYAEIERKLVEALQLLAQRLEKDRDRDSSNID